MSDRLIKILLIEDHPGDAHLIKEMLAQAKSSLFDSPAVEHAEWLSTALERLQAQDIDAILLDLDLPDSHGLDTFIQAHTQAPQVPIIVLSGLDNEALAAKAVQEGAQDYLVKGQMDGNLLMRAIRHAVERKRTEEEIRQRTAQLEALREVGLKITAELDLDSLLSSIVSQAIDLLEGNAGGLYLYRPDRDVLEWEVSFGSNVAPLGTTLHRGEGLAGKVLEAGEPLMVDDYEHWAGRAAVYEGVPVGAVVGMPVRWGEEFLGVLNVQANTPRTFSPADVELLSLFATQAAIAIRNARLFQESQTALGEMEALYRVSRAVGEAGSIEEIVRMAAEGAKSLGLSACSLTLSTATDDEGLPLRGDIYAVRASGEEWAALPPITDFPFTDRTAVRRLLKEPEYTLVYPDADDPQESIPPQVREMMRSAGIRGLVTVGLRLRGRTMGFLSFGSVGSLKGMPEGHVRRMRAYADQAAAAVDNRLLLTSLAQEKERLELLYRLDRHVSESLDVHDVAQRALDDVCAVVGAQHGVVLMRDPGSDRLRVAAASGYDAESVPALDRRLHLRVGDGLVGWVAARRELALVEDVTKDARWAVAPGVDDWVRSALSVPLVSRDELVGVLSLYSDQVAFFNQGHRHLVESAAATIVAAIANARLFEEEQRRRQEAETLRETALALTTALERNEVIERILAQLQEVVPYDSASVQLLKGRQLEIVGGRGFTNLPDVLGISFPVGGDNPNSEVVRTRAPLIVGDAPAVYEGFRREPHAQAGIRSWLGVPMLVGEQLVGMIALDKQEPGFYTQEHARLAEAFAAQAAIAVENSRLFQAEREQRVLTVALAEAAASISRTLNLDQVLDRILEQVEQVVAGDTFNIMLVEDGDARIVRWRGYEQVGLEDCITGFAMTIAGYPNLVKMAQSGEPVLIQDTATDPDWIPLEGREWCRSYVAAPIQVTGLTVGFLNVNGSQPGQFGPADAQRLEAFASYAAAAIENAQLYRELLNYAERLEERVQERTAQIQAQYARLEAILRSTSDGIVVTDTAGEILHTNPVAHTWLTQTLSPQDAERLQKTMRDLTKQAQERPETVLELKGLDLQLNAAPILEPGTEGAAAVVAIHDVSHLKELDRLKSRFVSNVSHELRTPITTIKLYLELIRRTPPEKWVPYVDAMEQEVEQQARLVEEILHISRIEAGRLEVIPRPTPLNQLTEAVVASHQALAQNQRLTLEYHPADSDPTALLDLRQMRYVLNNLVVNAIRYTPEGGTVMVSTGKGEAQGRVWATVTVADTGIGIPDEELPHIFERFFRGKKPQQMQVPGTGLGLTIVKEIVNRHSGRVTVESQVDVGSTFTIWLPLTDQ